MSATAHLSSSTGRRAGLVLLLAMLGATLAAGAAQASYGWPVKPFDRQHPVRGFFGDPRISDVRGDITGQLHFGIDVSAADGTAVYATLSGWASVDPDHPDVVDIVGGSATFSYWHGVPGDSRAGRGGGSGPSSATSRRRGPTCTSRSSRAVST
jgi:hypothetical protein